MNDSSRSSPKTSLIADVDAVVEAADRGDLVSLVLRVGTGPGARTHPDERAEPFVRLHREGRIDLLQAFSVEAVSRIGSDVERLAHARFYATVLPEIDTDVGPTMAAAARLLESGGGIGTGVILGAFRAWCERRPERCDVVLDNVASSEAPVLVRPALLAGFEHDADRFVYRAHDLAGGDDPKIAWHALGALEGLDLTGLPAWESASLTLFERLAADASLPEEIGVQALQSLVEHGFRAPERLLEILSRVLEGRPAEPSDAEQVVHARLLSDHGGTAPPSIIDAALRRLTRLDRRQIQVVAHLDTALDAHHEAFGPRRLSRALRDILRDSGSAMALDDFGVFAALLDGERRDVLGHLLVDALASSDPALGRALGDRVSEIGDERADVPFDLSPVPPARMEIVCRRAALVLRLAPVAATDLFVASLDVVPTATAGCIGDALFDTVGLNYPAIVRERLGTNRGGTRTAKRVLRSVIERIETYQEGVRRASVAVELEPSESDRRMAHRHQARTSQRIFAEARKHSILDLIATTSIVLHGTSTVRYEAGGGGEALDRREMPMQSSSVSMPYPRLDSLDPVARLRAIHAFGREEE